MNNVTSVHGSKEYIPLNGSIYSDSKCGSVATESNQAPPLAPQVGLTPMSHYLPMIPLTNQPTKQPTN